MIYKDAVSGSTVALFLDIEDEEDPTNEPVTGQTVTVAIRRLSDDKWFDFIAVTWDTIATYALLEASNKQALTDKGDGSYEYDWNQATADAGADRIYAVTYEIPSGDYQRIVREVWNFRADVARDDQWTDARAGYVDELAAANLPTDIANLNDLDAAAVQAAAEAALAASSIQTVTDKLDDTLEDDLGVYRFTENALEQAPTGTGSSLTAQETRDAMKLAPSVGAPAGGSIDAELDTIGVDVAGLDGAAMRGTDGAYTGTPPTAAAVADAVWDEASTGHIDAGKAGQQLWTDVDAIALDVAGLDGAAMRGTDGANTTTPPTASAVASQVRTELTTELGRIDATVSSRSTLTAAQVWANTTRTLSSFGSLTTDTATAVWAAGTRTLSGFGSLITDIWASVTRSLTDKANFTLSADYDAAKTAASASNLATVDTVVDAVKAKTDNLPASPAAVGSAMTLAANAVDSSALAASAVTEIQSGLATTANISAVETKVDTVDTNVDAILADTGTDGVVVAAASKTGYALTSAERTAIVTALLAGTITFPDGSTKTAETVLEEIWANAAGDYSLSGVNWTIRWPDAATSAMVFEVDDASDPTSRTRI